MRRWSRKQFDPLEEFPKQKMSHRRRVGERIAYNAWRRKHWHEFRQQERQMMPFWRQLRQFGSSSMMAIYDRQGRRISQLEHAYRSCDGRYLFIGKDIVGNLGVSTVWLGVDHNHGRGVPVFFETMTWVIDRRRENGGKDWRDIQIRYSTEREAKQGHDALVGLLRSRPDFDFSAVFTRQESTDDDDDDDDVEENATA